MGRLKLSEKRIQKIIADTFNTRIKLFIPNMYIFEWESDLTGITYSNFIHEYEIKLSHSDFKADFRKHNKHALFKQRKRIPNYFWYVCPEGIIKEDLVPTYAGLMYITDSGRLYIKKKAPRLHRSKLNQCKLFTKIAVRLSYRVMNNIR